MAAADIFDVFDDDEVDDDDDDEDALSVGDDGVRLITEQRTTGSGDGDRDTGFGCFVFKFIDSSVGNGSFSLINLEDDDCAVVLLLLPLRGSVLSDLFAVFG